MNLRTWLAPLCCLALLGCGPNLISSEPLDAGTTQDAGTTGGQDAGQVDAGNPYPPPPYGVTVNRVIQNFTFPGYFSNSAGVQINTLPWSGALDLQAFREAVDVNGKPFRFLLLDISGGWCPPCNQEAAELGLVGTRRTQIAEWLTKGGIFLTVLVEGYNQSTHAPATAADIETWANQHKVQSPLTFDPGQALIAQGINPAALPTNLVIDLRTMKMCRPGTASTPPTRSGKPR